MRIKPPTNDENLRLIRQAREGDLNARHEVIERNMGLCFALAHKYAPFDQRDDWAQCACIGLIEAVDTFDMSKGIRFGTYAFACARNYMLKHGNYDSETVRIPKWIYRCRAIIARNPHLHDAELSKMYPYYAVSMFAASRDFQHSYVPPDDESMAELVTHPDETPRYETAQLVDRLMSYLTDTEASIIRSRFCLDGFDALTLNEVGGIMGVTKTRVAQIQKAAIAAMRERANELMGEGTMRHAHADSVSSRTARLGSERMGGAIADRNPVAARTSRPVGYAQDAAR